MADDPLVAVLTRQSEILVDQVRATDELINVVRELKGWQVPIKEKIDEIGRYMQAEAEAKARIATAAEKANELSETARGERWKLAREAAQAVWGWVSGNIVLKGVFTLAISLLVIGSTVFMLERAGLDVDKLIRLVPGVESIMGPTPAEAPATTPEGTDG